MPGPMLLHLSTAAREARERAGLRQIDIATTAGVAHSTVSYFETARGWPMDADQLIAAYAEETGVAEREIWRRAMKGWRP